MILNRPLVKFFGVLCAEIGKLMLRRLKIPLVLLAICFLSDFSYAGRLGCEDDLPNCGVNDYVFMQDTTGSIIKSNYVPKWYDMFSNIPGDWLEWSKETFQVKNIPAIAGMSILTASLIATDYQSWQVEKKWDDESPAFHRINKWLVFTGDGRFQFGIVGIFAAYGFAFNDARALRTASQTTEAILACGGVVQLLKHITGRESPFVSTKRTGAWRFFPNQIDYARHVPHYDAFPSGHIATAMTTLIVIAENYDELAWLKPAGYVVLGMISSSLVATGIHWWSDIPLGLSLGYAFGEIASHPRGIYILDKTDENGTKTKLSFSPSLMPDGGFGIGFSLSF